MMRVLHFIPSLDRSSGGTSTYMQLLASELGKFVELHVATQVSENPLEVKNCQVHYVSGIRSFWRMKREWHELLRQVRPDVVHVNCCWMPECALVQKWSQNAGFRVVLSPHGMLEPWIMARHYWTRKVPALLLYQKRAIVNADCLHATAESEKENLLRLGYNNKVEVVPNGIDIDGITMKSSWKRRKRILFLSRVHEKKGVNLLIEAVSVLKDALAGYQVIIAGEGDETYVGELKELASSLGVADICRFVGGVYGDRKWELLRDADVFVLPTYSENFGIVVAEALASGTPVITTKGTPWSELESRRCGWWTEVGTHALVEVLRTFLALDESELEAMGRRGRRLVEDKYSARKMAEGMVGMYNSVI